MERKVYRIPRYVDDDPKALGIIPIDMFIVFLVFAVPLIWLIGVFKGFFGSIGVAVLYYRYVKKKGRGYYKLLAFKLGLHSPAGTLPPTEREVRA